MKNFEERLKGGHPNSLGNTVEVVEAVLAEEQYFDELFNCYFSEDQVVRLRTSNAIKRIAKAKRAILLPYIDRLLSEIALIEQASAQWTLAQVFDLLKKEMTEQQMEKAKDIMKHNLAHHSDWIVLTQTMNTLSKWAKKDVVLKDWMQPQLDRLKLDERKSISGRAQKMLDQLNN
ncbi:MAG: hypothetical protein AAF849_17355 [Bacteroidota bacterium]